MSLMTCLFGLPMVGSKILWLVVGWTGGQQESQILRDFTKKRYKVEVGLHSYGGCFEPTFNLGGRVTIGRYCSLASGIRYFGADHPMNHVSMSPYFYNPAFADGVKDVERRYLEIGNDCWIGYGAMITSKCSRIGNGAVVAAGSIVTRDVPAYAIVAGAPARVLRYRFDRTTIEAIETSRWWELEPAECASLAGLVDDPLLFCSEIASVRHQEARKSQE